MSEETLSNLVARGADASSRRPTSPRAPTSRPRPTTAPTPTPRPSGPRPPAGSRWDQTVGPGPRLGQPAVREVVRRRHAQRGLQLRRPPRRGRPRRPGRDPLGRRAGRRHAHDHLRRAQGRGLPGGQRAHRPRRRDRRPGRDLHADDPRGRRRDAGLRPHRRPAHRGLRRLLLRRAGLPPRGLPGQGRHHLRRRLPPRRAVRAQAGRRRGAAPRPPSSATRSTRSSSCGAPARTSTWDDDVDVWWHDAVGAASTEHALRVLRLRAPALRHVHLRHHRQAQGHPAHHRRLPHRRGLHALGGLRPQARDRRLLVHRRHRLGHRPHLHRLRPAGQRRRRRCSTRAPPTAPSKGRWWQIVAGLRRDASSTPRPPRSARS